MLTNEQFDRMRRLALRLAGLELLERHRALLQRRCGRNKLLNPASLDALLRAAEDGDPAAGQQFVSLITTKFTGFFRHPGHFQLAVGHAIEAARRNGRARLWSAAAATGEEPYSLAMALVEGFRPDEPSATILATDINEEALAVARRGEYGAAALGTLAPKRRTQFFHELAGTSRSRLVPAVQRLVEFRTLNLIDPAWGIGGQFDVILCRNVLMYLESCCRYSVLEHMASLLAPQGLLILDPAEHLGKAGHLFTPGSDGVYLRRRESSPPRSATRVTSRSHR